MQIVYSRCCGIDVHKDPVTACVLVYRDSVGAGMRQREFATYLKAMLNLKLWLLGQKVTQWPRNRPASTGSPSGIHWKGTSSLPWTTRIR